VALTSARSAFACLTTFVSASATMKYALAAISAGNRSGRDIDCDREVEPCHDRVDACPQAAVREGARKDSVREFAKLRVAPLRVLERLADERVRRSVVLSECLRCELQRDDRVHQPLLRAVVQVAHHTTAGLVARRQQARPGGGELVATVGVGDRGVEQLRETGHPVLGADRRRVFVLPTRRNDSGQRVASALNGHRTGAPHRATRSRAVGAR
jgi:hypothetical protein